MKNTLFKKIPLYIFKELYPLFIFANIFFIFLLLIEKLVQIADLFLGNNVSIVLIVETILLLTPALLVLTIPLASLLAVMLVFSRLSSDSEMIAIRSIGASTFTILKPVIVFAIIATCLALMLSLSLVRKSSILTINNLNKITENISIKDIKENEIYERIPGILLYVKKKMNNIDYEGLVLVNKSDNSIITATKASITPTKEKSIQMILMDGRITKVGDIYNTSVIKFQDMVMSIPMNIRITDLVNTPMTLSTTELIEKFSTDHRYQFELNKRFAVPFSSIILALFGFTLGVSAARSSKSLGMIIAVLIAIVYNFLQIYSEKLSYSSTLNPILGAWLTNIIFLLFLVISFRRVIK